jgi:hypothetical protein
MACAWYAYHINAKRSTDDPKKQKYHPVGILFAPITLPLLILSPLVLFILRVLTYAVVLILFPLALIAMRKPLILIWLQKFAMAIGNALLQANTLLLGLLPKHEVKQPTNIKIPASQGSL